MQNPYQKSREYADETHARYLVQERESAILQPYYRSFQLSREEDNQENLTDSNAIRLILQTSLLSLLKQNQQVSNVIEGLADRGDLVNFYRFERPFVKSIEGVRGLDASYLLTLWDAFKERALKEIKKADRAQSTAISTASNLPMHERTATEYEKLVRPYFERKQEEQEEQERREMATEGWRARALRYNETAKRSLEEKIKKEQLAEAENTIMGYAHKGPKERAMSDEGTEMSETVGLNPVFKYTVEQERKIIHDAYNEYRGYKEKKETLQGPKAEQYRLLKRRVAGLPPLSELVTKSQTEVDKLM